MLDLVLLPARLTIRALDDLHALAEAVRTPPPWVRGFASDVETVREELRRLTGIGGEVLREGRELRDAMHRMERSASQVLRELGRLQEQGDQLIAREDSLAALARDVHDQLRQVLGVAEEMTTHLPTLTGSVRRMEDSVEAVGDASEALQPAADRVGRVTQRLSRR